MSTEAPAATAPLPSHALPLRELDEVHRLTSAGERLARVRVDALRLRERVIASGRAVGGRTFDLTALPYPTRFAFSGAASSPVPYIVMTNRMNVVELDAGDGSRRVLLFNPT